MTTCPREGWLQEPPAKTALVRRAQRGAWLAAARQYYAHEVHAPFPIHVAEANAPAIAGGFPGGDGYIVQGIPEIVLVDRTGRVRQVVLAALVCLGRRASAQRPSLDSLPPGTSVAIRPLYGDDLMLRALLFDVSGLATERARQVIRDQPTWESFWSRARVSSARKVPPPVNFDRDMIIAASDAQSLAGPAIAILGAVARADSLYVLVRSGVGVLPGCRNNAYEHPMAIALLPKSNQSVVFVEMQRNERCGYRPPS